MDHRDLTTCNRSELNADDADVDLIVVGATSMNEFCPILALNDLELCLIGFWHNRDEMIVLGFGLGRLSAVHTG
ncbi:hypothetical protein PIB30_053953 [Stylosanthes scabra]|uniref:Uncharacterized protein n=1 Tax=Stylosanthes scabra TaxID=79078 RepID=A0ABU6VH60_9FABA|nr:hypothetical protein [Stylosanthes scabra]